MAKTKTKLLRSGNIGGDPETQKLIRKYLSKYRKLNDGEKLILAIKSLTKNSIKQSAFEPLFESTVKALGKESGIKVKDYQNYLKGLVDAELITGYDHSIFEKVNKFCESLYYLVPEEIPSGLNAVIAFLHKKYKDILKSSSGYISQYELQLVLESIVRVAFFGNDGDMLVEILGIEIRDYSFSTEGCLAELCFNANINFKFFASRSVFIQNYIIQYWNSAIFYGNSPLLYFEFEKHFLKSGIHPDNKEALVVIAFLAFGQGDIDKLEKISSQLEGFGQSTALGLSYKIKGLSLFLQNEKAKAKHYFEQSLILEIQSSDKKKVFLDRLFGFIYLVLLISERDSDNSLKVREYLEIFEKGTSPRVLTLAKVARVYYFFVNGHTIEANDAVSQMEGERSGPLKIIARVYLDLFLLGFGLNRDAKAIEEAIKSCEKAFSIQVIKSLPELGKVVAHAILKHDSKNEKALNFLREYKLRTEIDYTSLCNEKMVIQSAVSGLKAFFDRLTGADTVASPSGKRLVWEVDMKHRVIFAKEQGLGKNGNWTRGKAIPTYSFAREKKDYLTRQDQKVLNEALKKNEIMWSGSKESYYIDFDKALIALEGHPQVYDVYSRENLVIKKEVPHLSVEEEGGQITLKISENIKELHHGDDCGTILKVAGNRVNVVHFDESIMELMSILGENGITVPESEKTSLLPIIQKATSLLPISSNIEEVALPTIEGDPAPRIQVMVNAETCTFRLAVKPNGESGPMFNLAEGPKNPTTEVNGVYHRIARDMAKEKEYKNHLLEACPALMNCENQDNFVYSLELEEGLETLLQLNAIDNIPATIEWPQGKSISLTDPVTSQSLSLSINNVSGWLEVDGELKVNEDRVLNYKQLLELSDSMKGRFIPIGENQFITLTEKLRNHLAQLSRLSESGEKLHPLRSGALMELEDDFAKIKGDKFWKNHRKKIKEAFETEPEVPSTLHAELRDYQVEGFKWLSRLSKMGMGACLADDMGLGKTLQSIALLLEKGPLGPSLVIAPTSVCHNWISEISRFAPTLNPYLFSDLEGNKEEAIAGLKKMDILVCTYGLLQRNTDLLKSTTWEVIILDEAQAIKNQNAQRTRSATELNGNFKIALSGTPVENHLGEIWSIFNFINPGLLGSMTFFQRRFINPIQGSSTKDGWKVLRSLLLPFILRRTKDQVLSDLPPKIENNLLIEMSEEEGSFYEAVRTHALENIAKLEGQNSGQRKLSILAEITRLRRSCCHPALVDPKSEIVSQKMETLKEMVSNLIENKHKALIFSQYVGYMELIRKELEAMGVKYQYLDGSTLQKDREKRVEAFQAGEGDVFLISLKAGGMGLNLTAADYVFLMDPWWNPQVENQAFDRAHRIGQTRPVTIYRFLLKGTIEEKIVKELHRNKKDLSDNLLEGAETSGSLTEEELLDMINFG